MAAQSQRGEWREPRPDPASSVRYELKLELRRLERRARGSTPYASAIRDVLWILAHHPNEETVRYLEREISRPAISENDEPYAEPLLEVLRQFDESRKTAHELFSYYLQRLERQGRGHEPFAQAIRRALASNDASMLSALLHQREDADE